jgi:hypothetical protein
MPVYISHKKKRLSSMSVFVTVAALALPYAASGAGRAVGISGMIRASSPSRRPHGFHHPGFFGGDGNAVDVTVEQSVPMQTVQPDKPAKKRTYVQPRWVDGGYGVEVLEPGHWVETN